MISERRYVWSQVCGCCWDSGAQAIGTFNCSSAAPTQLTSTHLPTHLPTYLPADVVNFHVFLLSNVNLDETDGTLRI
jgi:hypothetical protein